jgi:hypothetical protein
MPREAESVLLGLHFSFEEGQPFGDRPSPIPRTTVDSDRR